MKKSIACIAFLVAVLITSPVSGEDAAPRLRNSDYLRSAVPIVTLVSAASGIGNTAYTLATTAEVPGYAVAIGAVSIGLQSTLGITAALELYHVYLTRDEKQVRLWRTVAAIEGGILSAAALGGSIMFFTSGGEATLMGVGLGVLSLLYAGSCIGEIFPYSFE